MAVARRVVSAFVAHYNDVRLHSAIGSITPADKLAELAEVIHAERDRKLETARAQRCQPQRTKQSEPALSTACEQERRERLAGVQGAGNEAAWLPEPLTLWI